MSAVPATGRTARGPLLALTLGHGCADLCSGALFALIPFLVVERDYTYAAVGVFAMAASVAGAVLQPVLGAHGDRRGGFWLMPTGLVLAGLGVGFVGVTASFPLTLAAVLVASAGGSAYHPEGARWARRVSGGRVNRDMGVFSLGGSIGYALGPLVVAATLAPLGLEGTVVIALIPLAAVGALLLALPRRRRPTAAATRAFHAFTAARSEWRPFALLLVFTCIGAGETTGLITYIPLLLVNERGVSPEASNIVTSVLLAAGAAGTLLGGLAAQRFGRRPALVIPQLLLAPLVLLLPSLGYAAMLPVVALCGLAMNTYMSITLVLAQEYLPGHMGFATGTTVGVSAGVSGLIVAVLGMLGDRSGVAAVLYAIALLPLAAAAIAALLPRPAVSAVATAGAPAEAKG